MFYTNLNVTNHEHCLIFLFKVSKGASMLIYILSPRSTAVIPGTFFNCSTSTVCDLFTQAIFKVNCSQCRNIMLVYMQMYLVYSN